MRKVIIMNGCGGSGKDTFVNYCKEASSKAIYKFSIIDWVKEKAELLGWDGGKTDKDRKFLSDLNDTLAAWRDLPYKMTLGEISACFDDERWDGGVDIVFVDIREPNIIDRLKEDIPKNFEAEVVTVLVDREIERTYGNHADDQVYDYLYDYVIKNTGSLDDLAAAASSFMSDMEND